jgi:hypothetical protein
MSTDCGDFGWWRLLAALARFLALWQGSAALWSPLGADSRIRGMLP